MKRKLLSESVSHSRGFTIVEILVVLVIMGIVALAVSSLYISSQRTASEQLGVSDVQANLRVAMDAISNDIRKAGFLTAADPVDRAASNGSTLVLQTSAFGKFAKVAADSPSGELTLDSAEMAEQFQSDTPVRLIRPPRFKVIQDTTVKYVSGVNSRTVSIGTNPGVIKGDILVGNYSGSPDVHRIVYFRRDTDNTLVRQVDPVPTSPSSPKIEQVLARNITGLEFQYSPSSGLINTVSVKITATTEGSNGKERELLSRVTVRNL